MQIVKTKVYSYDELNEEAKRKALEHFAYINVDYDWHEFSFEDFAEKLKEIGIKNEKFYFDLDRGSFFEMDNPIFLDEKKLMEAANCLDELVVDSLDSEVEYSLDISKDGHVNAEITLNDEYNDELSNKITGMLTEFMQNKLHEFLTQLQKEYDYNLSDEAIEETIKANDYTFKADGTVF